MSNTTIRTLEHGRAQFAYECAKEGSKIEKRKEYKSYVKKIPMLIKTNGLGAALAFMLSKGGTYEFIGEQVLEWLKNDEKSKFKIFSGFGSQPGMAYGDRVGE